MQKPLQVKFFRTTTGHEPVREWLRSLSRTDKKAIGEHIKTVQYGWPLGMPVVRKLARGLWEIRVPLNRRIARIIFTLENNIILLLHGFIKKSQKIPTADLTTAKRRLAQLEN
ncbi:MAG: type II toxin-antitoxin system RelE/ParE family toxin [Candidatus Latescibacteria bacterium]|nr:type II toxin-antitoxin system RelE/ParE family toxin [Candidatus Latescibacterota bacterium]